MYIHRTFPLLSFVLRRGEVLKTRDAEIIIANTEPSSSTAAGLFFAGLRGGN
jgi:hypothetical protein